ncbi:MAG TPA: hypothetical protein VH593_01940 [Ktedonobacteraceae bacterium]|jgi:hypothetical protein
MSRLTGKRRNRLAPKSFAVPKNSPVGGRGKAKYPIHDQAHARNAIARVNQHGSPAEKKMVYSAVKRKYPALAKRSGVIPTRTGTGRHHGQAKGTRNAR